MYGLWLVASASGAWRLRGQNASACRAPVMRPTLLVGKTVHDVGGLACMLELTNPHNESA